MPPQIWGVLNVTPDSFSDGGKYEGVEAALAHARRMIEEGADVVDIGGESTRPAGETYGVGAAAVPLEEELGRVIPVLEGLATSAVRLSIDTTKAEVAAAALEAGAHIVNDVSGEPSDALLDAVADADAELVLMHSRNRGRLDRASNAYEDVVDEVLERLLAEASRAEKRGVRREAIWIDPGIGFAKTVGQSAELLGNLDVFVSSGYPVLVGASRKSFIASLIRSEIPPDRRLGGSLAAATLATWAGCAGVRVHDVFESAQAVMVASAMRAARHARRKC